MEIYGNSRKLTQNPVQMTINHHSPLKHQATGGATCRDGRSVRLDVGKNALPSGCLQQLPRHLRLLTQLTRGDGSAQNHRVALHLGFLAMAWVGPR